MTRLSNLKGTLATAFGAAASGYHDAADVQREVAARLARQIAGQRIAPAPRVLEVGCGTGFLHHALAPDLKSAAWLLTDLSEEMVKQARTNIHVAPARFMVMDGEHPAVASGQFDLICASLVFQWFEDLHGSLARLSALLAPGGVMAFSTLAAGSFPEWRAAQHEAGGRAAVRDYPGAAEIAGMCPPGFTSSLQSDTIVRAYPNAHAFLAHWKAIGAHVPETGRAPLTPGAMRRLLRRFETGMAATYHVVYATFVRR